MDVSNEAPETQSNDFPSLPQFYVISKNLEPEQLERYRTALCLTPLKYLIILDLSDLKLAQTLFMSFEAVLRADSLADAYALAYELYEIEGARSLVIASQSEPFTSIYPTKERIAC